MQLLERLPLVRTGSAPRTALAAIKRAEGLRPRVPRTSLTVGLGDSITAGHSYAPLRIAASDSYFDVLAHQRYLGNTANLAVQGETAEQIAARLDDAIRRTPARALVVAGTNNVHLGLGSPVDALEEILHRLRAAMVNVSVGLLPPQDQRPGEVIATNDAIRRWATESRVGTFDLHAPVADDEGRWLPGMSRDGLHPTRAGSHAMAARARWDLSHPYESAGR